MFDHLVGKPSTNFKRTQIILTLLFGQVCIVLGQTRTFIVIECNYRWNFVANGRTENLPLFIQKLNAKAGK